MIDDAVERLHGVRQRPVPPPDDDEPAHYRDAGAPEPTPRWWLARVRRVAIVVAVIGVVAGIVRGCVWAVPRMDPSFGWCCDKPTKFHIGEKMTCVEGSPSDCQRYEWRHEYSNGCDSWVRKEGASGENCQ